MSLAVDFTNLVRAYRKYHMIVVFVTPTGVIQKGGEYRGEVKVRVRVSGWRDECSAGG